MIFFLEITNIWHKHFFLEIFVIRSSRQQKKNSFFVSWRPGTGLSIWQIVLSAGFPEPRGAKKTGMYAYEQWTYGPYKDSYQLHNKIKDMRLKKKLCTWNTDWKINTVFYNDLDSLNTLY